MRKLYRKGRNFFLCAAVITSIMPVSAKASGIPTVDVAAIAQIILDYTNQLEQYTELMAQSALEESQLLEAIRLYEQTMISYEHMLSQMQGLKDKLGVEAWSEVYEKYEDILNTYPPYITDFNASDLVRINDDLNNLYYRSPSLEDTEDLLLSLGYAADDLAQATEHATQGYQKEQLAATQALASEKIDNRLKVQVERAGEVADKRLRLGPEDYLATLQLMAEQNELMLSTMHEQAVINNTQLQYSNQMEAQHFSAMSQGRQATFNEVNAIQSESVDVNEDPLVGF